MSATPEVVCLFPATDQLEPERYKHLPDPIRLEDTVAGLDTRAVPDPDRGRNPEADFFLRWAAPI